MATPNRPFLDWEDDDAYKTWKHYNGPMPRQWAAWCPWWDWFKTGPVYLAKTVKKHGDAK